MKTSLIFVAKRYEIIHGSMPPFAESFETIPGCI